MRPKSFFEGFCFEEHLVVIIVIRRAKKNANKCSWKVLGLFLRKCEEVPK